MKFLLAVSIFAAACTPMAPARSSSSLLAPELQWVIVAKPAQPAALDIARIFQARGYALADFTKDERGVTLRLKGDRKLVSEQIVTGLDVFMAAVAVADIATAKDEREADRRARWHARNTPDPKIETYDLGSVYYVRVEPRGETMTSIMIVGRPTRDGVDACTPDPDLVAPCAPLESGPSVHPEISGAAEAELISGVFAELRLAGSVVAPEPPDIEAMAASRQCWEVRKDREAAAARVSDPRAKAGIMRTAPNCATPPPPSLAAK